MAELIAKNTIQRVLDGRFVAHAPGVRFEMANGEAEDLVRMRAAVYANPQDVVAPEPTVVVVQAVQPAAAPAPTPAVDVAETVAPSVDAIRAKRARDASAE